MLGDFGEVYVLDWGIAKLTRDSAQKDAAVHPSASVDLTTPGRLAGTLPYMSPEQASGRSEQVDVTSDVYALGTILFELLTFERMRPHVPGPQLMLAIHEGNHPLPSMRAPHLDIPPELDAICRRATMQHQGERYPTARKLHAAIEQCLAGERDGALRREAATRHLEAANRAVERALREQNPDASARRTALQEIGRALALDPTNADALKLLLRVITEAPRQLPADAEALLKADQKQRERLRLRAITLMGSATVFTLCMLLAMGARDIKLMAAFTGLSLASITLRQYVHWHGNLSSLWHHASHLLNLMIFFCYGRILGPLLLMLLPVVIHSGLHSLSPIRNHRRFVLVSSCALVLLMTTLEQLEVLAPSYLFRDGALVVLPNIVNFSPKLTIGLLLGFGLFAILLPGLIIGRLPEVLADAERRLALQAWHFRQLLPDVEGSQAAANTPADTSPRSR